MKIEGVRVTFFFIYDIYVHFILIRIDSMQWQHAAFCKYFYPKSFGCIQFRQFSIVKHNEVICQNINFTTVILILLFIFYQHSSVEFKNGNINKTLITFIIDDSINKCGSTSAANF